MNPKQACKKLQIPDVLSTSQKGLLNLLNGDKKELGLYSEEENEKLMQLLGEKSENQAKELIVRELALCQCYLLKKSKEKQHIGAEDKEKAKKEYEEACNVLVSEGVLKAIEKEEEYQKNKKSIQETIQFSEAVLSLLGDVNYTKGRLSEQVLKQKRERNKNRKDPYNQYPEYSGYPYNWGVKINRNIENFCLLDEANILGERVIVTKLGDFQYTAGMNALHTPNGVRSHFGYYADILGVTKLDEEGSVISNDVVMAQLDYGNLQKDKEFFMNVQLSQELIEHAKQVNNGYIGKMVHRKFSAQELNLSAEEQGERLRKGLSVEEIDLPYIFYNGPGTSELVSSLELAKFEAGTVLRNGETKKISNFEDLKKGLLTLQREYVEALKKAGIQSHQKEIDYMPIQQRPVAQEAEGIETQEIGEM